VAAPTAAGVTLSVPLPDFAPLQASLAVQAVELVEDHVRVVGDPITTEVGLAAIVTVGSGFTVTAVEAFATPPSPVHVSV
jgi:hypothetical protein